MSFSAVPHKDRGLRDLFIDISKDPVGMLIKQRERIPILEDISFKIYQGDRVGLIGINGAGKTTLCRCLANIYRPHRGTIKVYGEVRSIFDTRMGVYPHLTGRENAKLLVKFMYPNSYDHHAEMVDDAIAFADLGDFIDLPFRTYSNGMQARLCLSLISCRPADLLILDEVFDGADQFFREKISARILNVITNSGAVVFVSHSKSQITQVCNRVIYIKDTKIAFDGPPEAGLSVYDRAFT